MQVRTLCTGDFLKTCLTQGILVCYNRDAAGQCCEARRKANRSDLQRIRQLVIDRSYYLQTGISRPRIGGQALERNRRQWLSEQLLVLLA
jgi:hypothetical protein